MTTEALIDAALVLAWQGVPVFPCKPLGKLPITPNGFYDATTDEDQIRKWWTRTPNANIAIPAGLASGFDILDVDVRKTGSGFKAMEKLRDAGFIADCMRVVNTPSGGQHLYFKASGTEGNHTLSNHNIDFRGKGGYVLVPPSYVVEREKGYEGAYTLEYNGTYDELAMPFDWERCKAFLEPRKTFLPFVRQSSAMSPAGLRNWLRKQVEGNRNNGMFWAFCRAFEQGVPRDDLVLAALEIGLSPTEVQKTIGSAERRGK